MSGPKAYTHPPEWVERALSGSLRALYSLQANIADCERRLLALSFTLPDGRSFDGRAVLARTAEDRRASTRPLSDGKRRLEDAWKTYLEEALHRRVVRVKPLAATLERVTFEIEGHAADLETWTTLRELSRASAAAFEAYRSNVVEYLARNVSGDRTKRLPDAIARIRAVELAFPEVEFRDGIRTDRAELRKALSDAMSTARAAVEAVRSALVSSAARRTTAAAPRSTAQQSLDTTRALIDSVEDPIARLAYLDRLERLTEARGLDAFFIDELHDEILALEQTRAGRVLVSEALDTLRRAGPVATELAAEGRELLARERLDSRRVNGFLGRVEVLERASREAAAKRFVEQQGREFLRRSVVERLEEMGYRVATDLNTVDFTRPSELLLEVPGQDNAMSLRFQDGDRLAYRFLIPERTADLGADARLQKVHEMEGACRDFKRVVDDLRGIGVEMVLKAQAGISMESLVELTDQQQATLGHGTRGRSSAQALRSRRRGE